jgi:hypothetical protein
LSNERIIKTLARERIVSLSELYANCGDRKMKLDIYAEITRLATKMAKDLKRPDKRRGVEV